MFASAIVGRKEVPAKLRQLLNVESGINEVLLLIILAPPRVSAADVGLNARGLVTANGCAPMVW